MYVDSGITVDLKSRIHLYTLERKNVHCGSFWGGGL